MTQAHKTRKANGTKVQSETKVRALDKVIPYAEKVRLLVLEVLREESGRELAKEARFQGEEFDWDAHNQEFRSDYAGTSLKELMQKAEQLYGLEDLEAIKERRRLHKSQRAERLAHASA